MVAPNSWLFIVHSHPFLVISFGDGAYGTGFAMDAEVIVNLIVLNILIAPWRGISEVAPPGFHGKLPKLDWSSLGYIGVGCPVAKSTISGGSMYQAPETAQRSLMFWAMKSRQHYRDCHVHSGSWQPSWLLFGPFRPALQERSCNMQAMSTDPTSTRTQRETSVLDDGVAKPVDWHWEATSSGLNESTEARLSFADNREAVPAVPQIRVALSVHVRAVLTRVCDILTVSGAEPQE